jgi:hypothetical protein
MHTLPFSKAFAATATEVVSSWKKAGTDPADALRGLEKLCAQSGEEFHPDGTALVEKIYDGKFDGEQASNFVPNPATGASTATPPVKVAEQSTATPIQLGSDAPASNKTPDPRFHPPKSDTIAAKAARVPTNTPDDSDHE